MTAPGLEAILAPGALSVVFQPIVERGAGPCRLFGLEPLVRGPGGSNFASADVLFNYVRRKNEQVAVDRACLQAIFAAARAVPRGISLSVNVHAGTLLRNPGLPQQLLASADECGIDPARLIVEIVEDDGGSAAGFDGALRRLRAAGVRIALDDLGLGRSSLARLLDTKPDYVKLAPYFVHTCDRDPY
ncbi:MAG TPA: EAL domain-containing protein, partial [Vicinamibacteria bacterium]|nr:EAL domain-containing protein [Vicinamibacteria bacterium]